MTHNDVPWVVATDSVSVFKTPICARFVPQPDITAYELARILSEVWGQHLYEEQWAALGTLTRHFQRL